jgi:Zn-dependent M28 family amino/carboxypeptidase
VPSQPGIIEIVRDARTLADDSLRGRGPWAPETERVARILAARLAALGARPVFCSSLLVPFTAKPRTSDTVFNVVGVLPAASGSTDGRLVGITAHFDHLGVGAPDASGDSVYNGFLDDAIGVAMSLDVARRFAGNPGSKGLLVAFFNLEEQGLLGSKALVERADAAPVLSRLDLMVGVDAGAPAGEPLEWQLMGALPAHAGSRIAEQYMHGATITATAPRPISDVYPFSQHGVPILFPIPGPRWDLYSTDQRAEAMKEFDHYHAPADEYNPDFPLVGTRVFAQWLWDIIRASAR